MYQPPRSIRPLIENYLIGKHFLWKMIISQMELDINAQCIRENRIRFKKQDRGFSTSTSTMQSEDRNIVTVRKGCVKPLEMYNKSTVQGYCHIGFKPHVFCKKDICPELT